MRLFVSWAPGLPENAEAVRTLISCPLVAGIELCGDNDEVAAARACGLGVSVHNPFRSRKLGVQDPGFALAVRDPALLGVCGDAPVIGFHLFAQPSVIGPREEVERRCIEHLRLARATLGERVAFETTIWAPGWPTRFMVEPSFVSALLRESGAGLVFDTSHTFVTATELARETGREPEAILDELIAASAGRVTQLHCNVPGLVDGHYKDVHGVFVEGDELSERILALSQKVLAANPGLRVLTLEMYTDADYRRTDVVRHARIMVEQAELVARRLGIAPLLTA